MGERAVSSVKRNEMLFRMPSAGTTMYKNLFYLTDSFNKILSFLQQINISTNEHLQYYVDIVSALTKKLSSEDENSSSESMSELLNYVTECGLYDIIARIYDKIIAVSQFNDKTLLPTTDIIDSRKNSVATIKMKELIENEEMCRIVENTFYKVSIIGVDSDALTECVLNIITNALDACNIPRNQRTSIDKLISNTKNKLEENILKFYVASLFNRCSGFSEVARQFFILLSEETAITSIRVFSVFLKVLCHIQNYGSTVVIHSATNFAQSRFSELVLDYSNIQRFLKEFTNKSMHLTRNPR